MAVLIVINAVVLTRFSDASQKLVEQQSTTIEIRNELQTVQKEKTSIDSSLKEERLKTQTLESENAGLKAKKQARLEVEAKAALAVQTTSKKQNNAVAVTGTCSEWLAQAGIADIANASDLIGRESGCDPNVVNPSSGACGVAQELPCGKSGCSLGDGACQVSWMKSYVEGRYGSFAGAIAWHNIHNWY